MESRHDVEILVNGQCDCKHRGEFVLLARLFITVAGVGGGLGPSVAATHNKKAHMVVSFDGGRGRIELRDTRIFNLEKLLFKTRKGPLSITWTR